jgi:hypothetical protein
MAQSAATSEDIQDKKENDDIKGIAFDLRVPDEIQDRYFTDDGNMSPESDSMLQVLDNLTLVGIKPRLLRYGKIDPTIPEIDRQYPERYGFENDDDFLNTIYYALANNLELGIVAGNGILLVKVPFVLAPQTRIAEASSGSNDDMSVESLFCNTMAVSDVQKNVIFIFKYSSKNKLPSKVFKNGVEILNDGEIVKPKSILFRNKSIYEFGEDGTQNDLAGFYEQRYMYKIDSLFKGRIDEETRILKNCIDEIFTYKDEGETPLAVIGNRAYPVNSEQIADRIRSVYYEIAGTLPSTTKVNRALDIMKIVTQNYGMTIKEAPFVRDIQPVGKQKERLEVLIEALRALAQQYGRVAPVRALSEATGLSPNVISRTLNDNAVKSSIAKNTGINIGVGRDKETNTAIIELELIDGVYQVPNT